MPMFETVIPATGPDGNVFAVLGNARCLLKEIGVAQERIDALSKGVMESKSYREALDHIRYWFPVDTGDDE